MKVCSRVLTLLLAVLISTASLFACAPSEFDYNKSADYITVKEDYRTVRITVKGSATVDDAAVKESFNEYFKDRKHYLPIADATRPIADGDLLFFHYTGILLSKLEEAVAAEKISDVTCTGMTYDAIKALNLGFQGGTTSTLTSLEIGSDSYINGFEDGLLGLVPAEHGAASPYPLRLTFPETYGNAEVAGKDVIFFCAMAYIGDDSQGEDSPVWNYDNLSVGMLNTILGLSGENAYPSLDACLDTIRKEQEEANATELLSAKKKALWEALIAMAEFREVPDVALTVYVNDVIDKYFAQMQEIYEQNPGYYYQMFGTVAAPTKTFLIQYLGYSTDTYMQEMKEDALPVVKQEMLFHYFIKTEGLALTDARLAEMKAAYKQQYGDDVFDTYTEQEVYDQLLYDDFTEQLLKHIEENGQITYQNS